MLDCEMFDVWLFGGEELILKMSQRNAFTRGKVQGEIAQNKQKMREIKSVSSGEKSAELDSFQF